MTVNENQLYSELVYDICSREVPKYDKLAVFLYDLLSNRVKSWCRDDSILSGGRHYEDIMHEIQIRIIKKCEFYFFKPVDGKTDKTYEEFKAWCIKVGKYYFYSYCVKNNRKKEIAKALEINDESGYDPIAESIDKKEKAENDRKKIKESFAVVLDLKSSPHIILTWLSVSLFMSMFDMTKIKSTHFLVEKFSERTLDEMFEFITRVILLLEWLDFDVTHLETQKKKLDVIHKDTGKRIGSMMYSEFYMKKGPEASISDWFNRVKDRIEKIIE